METEISKNLVKIEVPIQDGDTSDRNKRLYSKELLWSQCKELSENNPHIRNISINDIECTARVELSERVSKEIMDKVFNETRFSFSVRKEDI